MSHYNFYVDNSMDEFIDARLQPLCALYSGPMGNDSLRMQFVLNNDTQPCFQISDKDGHSVEIVFDGSLQDFFYRVRFEGVKNRSFVSDKLPAFENHLCQLADAAHEIDKYGLQYVKYVVHPKNHDVIPGMEFECMESFKKVLDVQRNQHAFVVSNIDNKEIFEYPKNMSMEGFVPDSYSLPLYLERNNLEPVLIQTGFYVNEPIVTQVAIAKDEKIVVADLKNYLESDFLHSLKSLCNDIRADIYGESFTQNALSFSEPFNHSFDGFSREGDPMHVSMVMDDMGKLSVHEAVIFKGDDKATEYDYLVHIDGKKFASVLDFDVVPVKSATLHDGLGIYSEDVMYHTMDADEFSVVKNALKKYNIAIDDPMAECPRYPYVLMYSTADPYCYDDIYRDNPSILLHYEDSVSDVFESIKRYNPYEKAAEQYHEDTDMVERCVRFKIDMDNAVSDIQLGLAELRSSQHNMPELDMSDLNKSVHRMNPQQSR